MHVHYTNQRKNTRENCYFSTAFHMFKTKVYGIQLIRLFLSVCLLFVCLNIIIEPDNMYVQSPYLCLTQNTFKTQIFILHRTYVPSNNLLLLYIYSFNFPLCSLVNAQNGKNAVILERALPTLKITFTVLIQTLNSEYTQYNIL